MNVFKSTLFSLLIMAAGITGSRGEESSPAFSLKNLAGRYRGYNLLFIVLDTLRADRLGCYGYFRKTSPRIDDLAQRGVLFENAFVNVAFTLPSHASIFTGLYPQNTSVIYNYAYLPDSKVTLAELLQQNGYQTAAVVSTAVLQKRRNFTQGFERYYHNFDPTDTTHFGWELKGPADQANRLGLAWLKKHHKRKFFLWMHYYDIHRPRLEHPRFQDGLSFPSSRFTDYLQSHWSTPPQQKWKFEMIHSYDRDVAFTDYYVGELLDKIKEFDLLKKTVVVITSDHGNGLYQHHDYWSHGNYLYEEQIKVPLLLVLPDQRQPVRINNIVESVDIMPTLLELLGIKEKPAMDGHSLVELLENGRWSKPEQAYAFSLKKSEAQGGKNLPRQFCIRIPNGKLISTLGGEKEYYDLKQDPDEKNNHYIEEKKLHPLKIPRLTQAGNKWLQPDQLEKIPVPILHQKTEKQLRSLGYLQ